MKLNKDRTLLAMDNAGIKTFKDLAVVCGVSRQTISSYCCGKSVQPSKAKQIADALNVDVTEIIE